jgi:hypothetical protein
MLHEHQQQYLPIGVRMLQADLGRRLHRKR